LPDSEARGLIVMYDATDFSEFSEVSIHTFHHSQGWLSLCQVLYKQIAKTVLALGISLFFVKPEVMMYFGPFSKRVMKS